MAFQVGDFLGRRKELILGSLFYIVGGFVEFTSGQFCSHSSLSMGALVLTLGRLLYGIGCGFSMH
eukprot:Awhi_evm1s8082